MSKILIVDDKPAKYAALLDEIDPSINSQKDVVVVGSIRDGLKQLQERRFDILVLDMLLPETPWGTPIEDGGIQLLEHLEEDPDLKLPKYIIGITASSDAIAEVEKAFQSKPWVLLRTANGAPWEERLLALVRHAIKSEIAQDARSYKTDICLITALRNPEFNALTKTPIRFDETILMDSMSYVQKGTIESSGQKLSIAVGCCLHMGSTESALLSAKLIEHFRPRIFGMAGICAGYEELTSYGDVIVANPCWDYSMSSKITREPNGEAIVTLAPDFITVEREISARFENLSLDKEFLSKVLDFWPGDKPRQPPAILVGPSATGPAVVADASVFKDLRQKQHRATIGMEMEAYGVYCAARKATRPKPLFFSAKAVCDFGSFLKDDKYQKYAAYTSASVITEFLSRYGYEICQSMP